MNILVDLAHPRHYYQFKYICELLEERGHKVYIAATDRPLLMEILNESGVDFILFKHTQSGNRFIKLWSHVCRLDEFRSVLLRNNIDVYISKASIGSFFVKVIARRIMTVIFPDSEDVSLTNNFVRFFSDLILLPKIFPLKWQENKVVRVNGTCENCYLDPRYLKLDSVNVRDFGYPENAKFVFFRFVAWKAHHDVGQYGFNRKQRIEVVNLFLSYGFIPLISFEDEPDPELSEFVNRFPKSKVRSVLQLCDYFVGDSQSMAAESALLGLKSFRYNSWVLHDVINFKHFNRKRLLLNYSLYDDLKDDLIKSLNCDLDFFQPVAGYWDESGDVNKQISDEIEARFAKHRNGSHS